MRAPLVVALLLAGLVSALGAAGAGTPSSADRAVAFGMLIDTPTRPEMIDRSIRIADGLRRHYGLHGGDPLAARRAAAERAAAELEQITFERAAIVCAARALKLRVDGPDCGKDCAAGERIAELELSKATLESWSGVRPANPHVARCLKVTKAG